MTSPAPGTYNLLQAQSDIAGLRGQIALLLGVVATVSDKAVLLYAPDAHAIPRGPSAWSWEDGTVDGWTATNGAVSNSTVTAAGWPTDGTHSLLLTANGAGQPQAVGPATITAFVASQPGDPVTVQVDIYCPASLSHVYAGIRWLDDTGTLISEVDSTDTIFMAGQVLTLSVSGPAPDLCAGFAICFGDHATDANGTLIYGDNIKVQGNLAISASPGGGTDSVGNPYPAGVATIGATGNVELSSAAINFNLLRAVFGGSAVMLQASPSLSGVPGLLITSPSNKNAVGANSQALIGLAGGSADGSKAAYVYLGSGQFGSSNIQSVPVLVVGGQLVYAAPGVAGGNLVAETWHTLTLSNGWTGTLRYKLLAELNLIHVNTAGLLTPGTKTDGTLVATLPAGYRPASSQFPPVAVDITNAAGNQSQHFSIDNTGAIKCFGCASAGAVYAGFQFPTD